MATYYEDLLKRLENVDMKGQPMAYTKETAVDVTAPSSDSMPGYTALRTPDGRVFGYSNYNGRVPGTLRQPAATPAMTALNSLSAPPPTPVPASAPVPGGISPLPATATPPTSAPTNTGLPGTFGGRAAIGSAGWWSDGKGGNVSVLPPGMDTTEAASRLARASEIDRINREAERRMSGGRVGGIAKPAAESYDKRLMKAQAGVEKDRQQLAQRESAAGKLLSTEQSMQDELKAGTSLMDTWRKIQEDEAKEREKIAKKKGKRSKDETEEEES